jgi:hypothetical protein
MLVILAVELGYMIYGGTKKEVPLSNQYYEENTLDKNPILKEDSFETLETVRNEIMNTQVLERPIKVKGIYITGKNAGSNEVMEDLIQLVKQTELNAMVIDVKNDWGEITYQMDSPLVEEVGSSVNAIQNIEELIKRLKDENIYLIGRIVAFKDSLLGEKRPEYCLKTKNGKKFRDKSGMTWLNPYKKQVWNYLIEIAENAVRLGFDEIQFDYIRFSTDKGMKDVDFEMGDAIKTKQEIITDFTAFAYDSLGALDAKVSADVFGAIMSSEVDGKALGQNYIDIAKNTDYISPMIYPSHYAKGSYGIQNPDKEPYQLILKAMENSRAIFSEIEDTERIAKVRPWLQDFTASWLDNYMTYGEEEIKEQIQAVYDAGYEEWILWNASNKYTKGGLLLDK